MIALQMLLSLFTANFNLRKYFLGSKTKIQNFEISALGRPKAESAFLHFFRKTSNFDFEAPIHFHDMIIGF